MTAKPYPEAPRSVPAKAAGPVRALLRRIRDGLRAAGRSLAGINISIRSKILVSLSIVIVLMGGTNIILMVQLQNYSQQYDSIITNITTANSISGTIKPAIDAEIWKIVAGTQDFDEGLQYQIIGDAVAKLQQMMANTDSPKAKLKLDVILRTMQTLTESVDAMGRQIEKKSTAAENEAMLENIRFITSVLDAGIQDYVLFEAQRTNLQYQEMRAGFIQWEITYVILLVGSVCFSVLAAWGISGSIYRPIRKLHDVTSTITKQDLQALVTHDNIDEITELGMSFNIMIGKIRDLLDSKIKEQENLKKAELRALQAQINPHFLYNTLDTIIWMAEAGKNDQVIEIVSALSNFFRISLSKGQDWITVGEEIERTRSYLTIQKIRYRDILDYRIEAEEQVLKNAVLKLVLQPLVENALYHGVKNKRQGGTIVLRAKRNGDDEVVFEVEDDGIGFTPAKLAQVREELAADTGDIRMESGFGIGNVNKRIKLYYGKQYGLSIESEYGAGTRVRLVIPTVKDAGAGSA